MAHLVRNPKFSGEAGERRAIAPPGFRCLIDSIKPSNALFITPIAVLLKLEFYIFSFRMVLVTISALVLSSLHCCSYYKRHTTSLERYTMAASSLMPLEAAHG